LPGVAIVGADDDLRIRWQFDVGHQLTASDKGTGEVGDLQGRGRGLDALGDEERLCLFDLTQLHIAALDRAV
jgi:hypothetical protein